MLYENQTMTCLIVDNDSLSKAVLIQSLRNKFGLLHPFECNNAVEAYTIIQSHGIDIVFIEIELPEIDGLEFVKNLGEIRPLIIFTTKQDKYAMEAFELRVFDYLLKPIQPDRLRQALTKAKSILVKEKETKQEQKEYIFIKDSNVIRRLKINDILYAEAMGDYVKLFTAEKYYAIHTRFATVEQRLPPDKFLRIHRSFMVALDKIDCLQDRVLTINGKCLPVALTYKQALSERMNILA